MAALGETANATEACRIAGVSRDAVYAWRNEDSDFRAKWEAALELGTDALEDEAVRRAHAGTDKPVFYQGTECGKVREYSDTLMIFMLKARRPDRFKDRTQNENLNNNVTIQPIQYAGPGDGRDQATDPA